MATVSLCCTTWEARCASLWQLTIVSPVRFFVTIAHQAPLPMEFSRQKYWRGLPFPTQRIFPTQGLNPRLSNLLHWQEDYLPLSTTWEAQYILVAYLFHRQQLVPLNPVPLYLALSASLSPLVSTSLFSITKPVYILLYIFTNFFKKIPHISDNIQHLSL